MADKGSKKKTGLTLACIILAVLVIFIVFLVKKDTILTNLKETRFFERVFGSTPEFVENHTPSENETVKIPLTPESDEVVIKVEPQTPSKPAAKEDTTQEKAQIKQEEPPAETKKPAEEKKPVQSSYTELQLCFVEIDADGSINRKIVKRKVAKPKNANAFRSYQTEQSCLAHEFRTELHILILMILLKLTQTESKVIQVN